MECLRSFIVSIDQAGTFSGADVKTWLLGGQEYWALEKYGFSSFEIQGYKNINIYGVDVIGQVQTQKAAALGGCVIQGVVS